MNDKVNGPFSISQRCSTAGAEQQVGAVGPEDIPHRLLCGLTGWSCRGISAPLLTAQDAVTSRLVRCQTLTKGQPDCFLSATIGLGGRGDVYCLYLISCGGAAWLRCRQNANQRRIKTSNLPPGPLAVPATISGSPCPCTTSICTT